ncbi:MAG: hypothetical protein WEC75_08010 [Dehalococcoidia bacterium]
MELLTANGFVYDHSTGGHDIYKGAANGRNRSVTVDQQADDFSPRSHELLFYIASQLGFIGEGSRISQQEGWRRFYGGHPGTARRAQVPHRKWSEYETA